MLFRQILLLDNVMEKLSTFAELKDQEANVVPLPDFVKFNDIWMIL